MTGRFRLGAVVHELAARFVPPFDGPADGLLQRYLPAGFDVLTFSQAQLHPSTLTLVGQRKWRFRIKRYWPSAIIAANDLLKRFTN